MENYIFTFVFSKDRIRHRGKEKKGGIIAQRGEVSPFVKGGRNSPFIFLKKFKIKNLK